MSRIALELVRSDMGDGGWSLHAHRTDIDEQEDPVAAWPILLSGESEADEDGDWIRPTEEDYDEAQRIAEGLSAEYPLKTD